jgi:hypothetical protein
VQGGFVLDDAPKGGAARLVGPTKLCTGRIEPVFVVIAFLQNVNKRLLKVQRPSLASPPPNRQLEVAPW